MSSPSDEAGESGYVRLFELARGGLGRVDVAVRRGRSFERLYAVKRLLPHLTEDREILTMFLREAQVAGLVRHANVASVLDVGEDDDGPYLVMDYVDGVSVRQLLMTAGPDDLIPVQICLEIATQTARGLHAAHEMLGHDGRPMSLVHRDVSPQNVLIGFDGVVRVADFGIAKVLGARSETTTGLLKGKLGYMSPEQLRFEPLDARSDLFSLGVVLWEMLAATRLYKPRDGDLSEIAQRILRAPPPDIGEYRRDVPRDLEQLLLDLLAKSQSDRPQSARESAERLDEIAVEVAALEGPIRLDVWLAERCGALRTKRRSAIADAIAALDAPATVPNAPALPVTEVPAPDLTATVREEAPRRWRWIAVVVSLIALASLGIALALGVEEDAPSAAPVTAAPPATSAPSTEADDAPAPAEEPSADDPPAPAEDPPAVIDDAADAGAEERPTTRPTPMRRRRRRAPPMTMASSDGWWPRM